MMKGNCSDVVVGLDLAGVANRPTGFCVLTKLRVDTELLYENEEIIRKIRQVEPQVVAIDAPLSLPKGRKSIEEKTSTHLRECDKELLRRRIKFFPITIGPMRKLTTRGIELRQILEGRMTKVIEVFPGGAQDILSIPRKQRGLGKLRDGLEKLGIKGLIEGLSDHELDAVTCAYIGHLFLKGRVCSYGTGDEVMVMPEDQK